MKKFVFVLWILVVSAILFAFGSFGAEAGDDYSYTESKNYVLITGYKGSSGKLEIPATINGKPVKIRENAFCDDDDIRYVYWPAELTEIPKGIFDGCYNIKRVYIPKEVTRICQSAFYLPANRYTRYVYYQGTEEEWQSMVMESENFEAVNTEIYYNQTEIHSVSDLIGAKRGDIASVFSENKSILLISAGGVVLLAAGMVTVLLKNKQKNNMK